MSNFSPEEIKTQITTFRESGGIIRNTPVMLQWPWNNGIPLEAGSLVEAVRRLGDINTEGTEGVLWDMILVCEIPSLYMANADGA